MISTTIRSPRQDAIEPRKPAFAFYYEDEPQYVAHDPRGRVAHLLRCYRRNSARHVVVKVGTHAYRIFTVNSAAVARIESI
jgi:hypothetical protein